MRLSWEYLPFPTAEAVLRDALGESCQIDSAGTGSWHIGKPPYPPAIKAAGARGYDLNALTARQFTAADFEAFDLILAMERQNLADIEAMRPPGSDTPVKLLLDFAPDAPLDEVPDPYYTGDFEEALNLIEQAARGLVSDLR